MIKPVAKTGLKYPPEVLKAVRKIYNYDCYERSFINNVVKAIVTSKVTSVPENSYLKIQLASF